MKTHQSDDAHLTTQHKLKFEHINLTSFSKMRVDLAAQVSMNISQELFNLHVLTKSLVKEFHLDYWLMLAKRHRKQLLLSEISTNFLTCLMFPTTQAAFDS